MARATATRATFTAAETLEDVRRRAGAPAADHRHGQGRRAGRRRDRRARAAARRGRHRHRRRQLALRRHAAAATRPAPSAGCASSAAACRAARRARCTGRASCPAARARPTPRSRRSSPRSPRRSTARRAARYIGPDGAGHYVKMVHNGIEYADMQLIAESYDLLRHGAGLDVAEIARRLRRVEHRRPRVVPDRDHRQGAGASRRDDRRPLSTRSRPGRAEGHRALDRARTRSSSGVPLTAITEAVFARSLSALRDQRAAASERARRPASPGDTGPATPSSTTSATRCTRARSSPTRRASSS